MGWRGINRVDRCIAVAEVSVLETICEKVMTYTCHLLHDDETSWGEYKDGDGGKEVRGVAS